MRKPKNTVINEKNVTDTNVAESDAAKKETVELKEESAPIIAEEVPEAKKTTTRKTTTRKATTKAAKSTSKKEPEPETPKTRAARTTKTNFELFVQYEGKEFAEKDILERVKNIWVNELGNSPSKLKDVKIYFKPEESTVYYVWNDSDGGSFTL